MASNFIKFSVCCAIFILFFLGNESLASSSNSSHPEAESWTFKRLSRYKRQKCADGVYQHEEHTCCLCAAGQRVTEHCTASTDTKCEPCGKETYNKPSSLETCQPCTSCAQPNANLQVEEACTPAKDTKCRCKDGYYCNSDSGNCKVCQPCKTCGSAGIKQDCTATNDTVCSDESNGSGIITGVVVVVLLVVAAVIAWVFWRKKDKRKPSGDPEDQNRPEEEEEMKVLTVPDVDLGPLVPEIVEVLGWKVMEDLATRSGITRNRIADCERNRPSDSQEQTRELLGIWVEKMGRGGSKELIRKLREMKKNATADKVLHILNKADT